MATYLQGITDYIPKIQPFKPDLNFYSKVLQVKQNRYDAALKNIGNIYGTLLYAPMTGKENIQRRDDYFKMIEQDLKKISGMDLSLPQNQTIASSIFEPLVTDKYIAHDMSFTKHAMDQLEYGKQLSYCSDPDKCGGSAWDEGDAYIQGYLDDYSKATPEERLTMKAPDYHAKIDITKKAMEWTKDQGLVVDSVTDDGNYIVTKTNGQQMLLPLQQIYSAIYGEDQKVKDMYSTMAYVRRKSYILENKDNFGGDEAQAENAWFNDVMRTTGEKLLERQKMIEGKESYAKYKKGALEAKIKREGISKEYAQDDPRFQEYMKNLDDERYAQVTNQYYKGLVDDMKNLKFNPNDRKQMRAKIDNIVGGGLLEESMHDIATLYADTHSATTKIEADPFKMEYVKHIYKMEEDKNNHNLDYEKQLKLKMFDMTKDMYTYLQMSGGGSGKLVNPDSDQVTGAEGNLFTEYSKMLTENTELQATAETEYINKMVQKADSILSNPHSSGDEILTAKRIKKSIFGNFYNDANNQFINNGATSKDWTKLGISKSQQYDIYKKALQEYGQNIGLFSPTEINDLTRISDNQNMYWSNKTASNETLAYNANEIYKMSEASDMVKDKTTFKMLFKKQPDGRYGLKNQNDFVDEYSRLKNVSKRTAAEEYDKQAGIFIAMHNQGGPSLKGINGLGLTEGNLNGGKITLAKVVYDVNALNPIGEGTQSILSLKNDMWRLDKSGAGRAANFIKIVPGTGYEKKDFEKIDAHAPEQRNAGALVNQFFEDMGKVYGDKKSKKIAPSGSLVYKSQAANSNNIESYHIIPSYEWLKSYADKKGIVFGRSIEDWRKEGVTVYKDKTTSGTILTKQFEQHPYDAVIKQGRPISIFKQNAGQVTIQYKKNSNGGYSTFITGHTNLYDRLPNGKIRVSQMPINQEYESTIPGFSPGKLFAGARETMDALELQNYNIKFNNAADDKIFTPEQLQQFISDAQLRQGLRQPTEMEKFGSSFQEQFNTRMGMVNEMLKTVNNYGR